MEAIQLPVTRIDMARLAFEMLMLVFWIGASYSSFRPQIWWPVYRPWKDIMGLEDSSQLRPARFAGVLFALFAAASAILLVIDVLRLIRLWLGG